MKNLKISKSLSVMAILMVFTFVLISCTSEQPKCDGNDVKEVLYDILKEQLQIQLEENYFRENYNYKDVRNYAKDNNLDLKEVDAKIEKQIKDEARELASTLISKASFNLEEVRILNIEEDIKKCDCAAKIIIDNIEFKEEDLSKLFENLLLSRVNIHSGMEIKYSAQNTEDDKVYVELYY